MATAEESPDSVSLQKNLLALDLIFRWNDQLTS